MSLASSCGRDDENESSSPKVVKHISKIVEETQGAIRECVFSYDTKDRVVEMKMTTNSANATNSIYTRTFQYGETIIVEKEDISDYRYNDSYYPYPRTSTYTLSNGLIVKRREVNDGNSRNISFSYNSNGYMESYSDFYDDGYDYSKRNLTWKDGNPISVDINGQSYEPYTYSSIVWKTGTFFDLFHSTIPETDPILFATGFYGKLPTNLPLKSGLYSYQYMMSNGLVTKVEMVCYDDINNKVLETSVMNITWE